MSDEHAQDPEGWVDRHGDCLYRYALLRLGTPEVAADVVQETFVEALRALSTFSGRSSERTWLVGILKHRIVDHLRRSGRRDALQNGLTASAEVQSDFDHRGRWRRPPAAWPDDPARVLETREFWDAFGRCLARVPRSLADAFLLRELDGLTSDEVQTRLGITPANLWARLHRARSLLRNCLEAGWIGRPTQPLPVVNANGESLPP